MGKPVRECGRNDSECSSCSFIIRQVEKVLVVGRSVGVGCF
jgi:hypothetical protein